MEKALKYSWYYAEKPFPLWVIPWSARLRPHEGSAESGYILRSHCILFTRTPAGVRSIPCEHVLYHGISPDCKILLLYDTKTTYHVRPATVPRMSAESVPVRQGFVVPQVGAPCMLPQGSHPPGIMQE